ncbi:MAG: MucR family transcriptional regulator [Alphaproteobacteria bacterium]
MAEESTETVSQGDVLRLATEVVASYVRHNELPASRIPEIIHSVHGSLSALNANSSRQKNQQKPAVPVRKSVTPDYIICLEDGKKLKMLKRHLRSAFRLTPEEYRAKWDLSPDYPMVAPNYAAQRSLFAKQIGLGRKRTPA